jgi:outer membrane protein TolC
MSARAGSASLAGKDYQCGLFPTVTAGAAINRSHTSDNIGSNARAGSTITDYQLPIDLSWELDIWGNIRRTVEAAQANAQASASDLEVTTSQYKVGIACALDVITR